jgi:hypothetical protein
LLLFDAIGPAGPLAGMDFNASAGEGQQPQGKKKRTLIEVLART